MSSKVNPKHYKLNGYEVIDVIFDLGHGEGFCIGNALKYLSRAGRKEGESKLVDLKKALWYTEYLVAMIEDEDDE